MTNEQTSTLVFKNEAGEYYLLPQATLEQGRVSEEHKAEVERLIEGHGAGGDDVQGYHPVFFTVLVLEGTLWGYSAVTAYKEATATGTLGPGLRR